jgi:hypothetical protein
MNNARDGEPKNQGEISVPITETIIIALLTAFFYMMTSSYEFGYREAFALDYNQAIGPAEITGAMSTFLLPLASALAISFVIAIIISFLFSAASHGSNIDST